MNWFLRWPEIFLVVLVAALEAYRWGYAKTPGIVHATWSPERKSEMRCVIRQWHTHNELDDFSGTKYATSGIMGTPVICSSVHGLSDLLFSLVLTHSKSFPPR